MTVDIGVVMDPIATINIKKDSSFAMMLAAQARGWRLWYMEPDDLLMRDGVAWASRRPVTVTDNPGGWYELGARVLAPLYELDAVLMRKDPPVRREYIYATYILEAAERDGTLVVNRPQALRDVNEKLYTAWFPEYCTPTLVDRDNERIRDFLMEHGDVILKPLDAMGGESVFRLREGDPNTSVVLELMTDRGRRYTMVQRFIPEIRDGDKRILLVDGEAVPYALARIPARGETRGNLAAGGRGMGVPLSERDREICARVAPSLREKGLVFVGLDVIGDWLTEVNVTSPTCIRELDAIYGLDIAGRLMDAIHQRLTAPRHA